MTIVADDKDWTWVLTKACGECGFDPARVARADLGPRITRAASAWAEVLRRASVTQRPSPTVWSPLEYGCHVRDVFSVIEGRLEAMLTSDDAHFANWDQDATALADDYAHHEPLAVAEALVEGAQRLAHRYRAVTSPEWDRTGTRSDGAVFTVASLGAYLLHDVEHHLVDVGAWASVPNRVLPPWEPPLAGTEVAHLLASLDRLRATFAWKVQGLDRAGLSVSIGASTLTLGGLLKHLARVEDDVVTRRLLGTAPSEPWRSAPLSQDDAWEFSSSLEDTPDDLYVLWSDAVERTRSAVGAAIADGGLEHPLAISWDGVHPSLRRLLFDLVEEYGRHTGHADLLREAVDGRVGEDPPADMAWPDALR